MRNKGIVISVAVGVAALSAAGILMSKRSKSKSSMSDGAQQLSETFKHKLSHLQRKAQKELKISSSDGSDLQNAAKDRANQWVTKSGANL